MNVLDKAMQYRQYSTCASRVLSTVLILLVAAGYSAAAKSDPDRLQAVKEKEPVYLEGLWFHSCPGLNIVKRPDGGQQAVDNDGRMITDGIALPPRNHIGRPAFHSLRKLAGEYYIGLEGGYGRIAWLRVSDNGVFADLSEAKDVDERIESKGRGYLFDNNPVRGDAGILVFPAAGLSVTCARGTTDSRFLAIVPFGAGEAEVSEQDNLTIPIQSPIGRSIHNTDFPDRVFADPDGKGFWYLGSFEGRHAVVHSTPGRTPAGHRSLNLTKRVMLGSLSSCVFDAGATDGRALYLLFAAKNPEIGGVKPERRLFRIELGRGVTSETALPFDSYITDVRLACWGDRLAVHSGRRLAVLDAADLKELWSRDAAALAEGRYLIRRVLAGPDNSMLAVGLSTPYSRPGEKTQLLLLDQNGDFRSQWRLKPGTVDDLAFTDDGGLLFFSSAYTAKLGGEPPARNGVPDAALDTGRSTEAIAAKPAATFLKTPLSDRHRIWFADPGKQGRNLMIGNGQLGAMFDANTKTAGVSLNVDSMWTGNASSMGAYQAFARMAFHLGHDRSKVSNYRCQLDYRTGQFTLTYTYNGVNYRQEAFCSYPRGLLAVRYSADSPGVYSGLVELSAMHKSTVSDLADGIEFTGKLGNQHRFKGVMRVKVEGGSLNPAPEASGTREKEWRRYTTTMPYRSLRVEKADAVTLYFAGDTDYSFDADKQFFGCDPAEKIAPRLANITKMTFEEMRKESAEDVSSLFDRCAIDLATAVPEAEALPTDKRRAAYGKWEAGPDTGLEVLHFDAAKYLMIASSRKGSLPANLQGVWNDSNWPAWTSDYHADINLEMNYWFVEPANLAECAAPLFDYIESQIPIRRKVAREIYGEKTRGWSVHFMNNIFGGHAYANMPAGSAWYASHFAEHFKFGQDVGFLKERSYPVLKELSEHWQDLLIERPDGKFVTPKTMSPEHKPKQFATSQDLQIVHNLLSDYAHASTRLGTDAAFRDDVLDMRERLVAPQIGRWGQLQEWEVDRDSRFCTHRHIQHLFAAFPGSDITPRKTPELSEAGIRSLEARGMGSPGWSKAWRISIFARFNKPTLVYRQIRALVKSKDYHDNLMWYNKQQIDAPCGYAAGVCEALLQSHEPLDDRDERFLIHLLPALPAAWPHGKVKGLRARGGFEVDMEWRDGKLTRAWIKGVSNVDPACTLHYAGKDYVREVHRNKTIEFVPEKD